MWSSQRVNMISGFRFYVRCMTTTEMLGTQPGNPQLHHDFIESKNPNLDGVAEEEIAVRLALTGSEDTEPEDIMEKQMTIFPQARFFFGNDGRIYDPIYDVIPKDLEGEFKVVPIMYDYQIRGSFKESIAMLAKAAGGRAAAKENGSKYDCAGISNYKKTVDGNWFVTTRKIPLLVPDTFVDAMGRTLSTYDENGNLRVLQRPLRADTAKGPRTALASSEVVPAGTQFYFGIQLLNAKDLKACLETLDYKSYMGMLQWRGGGKGTLVWTFCNRWGTPYEELTVDELEVEDKQIIATVNEAMPGMIGEIEGFDPSSIIVTESTKKRGGKKKAETAEPATEEPAPKKRGRKKKSEE